MREVRPFLGRMELHPAAPVEGASRQWEAAERGGLREAGARPAPQAGERQGEARGLNSGDSRGEGESNSGSQRCLPKARRRQVRRRGADRWVDGLIDVGEEEDEGDAVVRHLAILDADDIEEVTVKLRESSWWLGVPAATARRRRR